MSQTKAQIIQPVGIFTAPGVNVSGVLTASSFSGNLTGSAAGLTGTPNVTVGVITATSFYGSGANLTGVSAAPYVGQSTTSQSPTTTIDLSKGNVVYFTHNTYTTVAFANTNTTQEVRFIRVKDDTSTARSITWPSGFIWDNGSAPTLVNNPRSTDAQIFNLTTRDGGVTWYAYEEFTYNPQTFALYAWGLNSSGQLGQNNRIDYSSPVQIPGTQWSSISGRTNTFAIKTDGTLWSWGSNTAGRLGQNNITPRSSPVQIPGTTWRSISSGDPHALAIKTDGTLWAWGNGDGPLGGGQLAQNNTVSYSSPVQIPGTTWRSAASSDFYMSIATKTDGTLWVWGSNWNGQLGINEDYTTRNGASSPVQIPGNTWNLISAGRGHVLATKTDGTLWVWGGNVQGQLGQNDTTVYSSPRQIPGTTWSSIFAADSNFSFATKTDGTLWSWGYNGQGNLGQNNKTEYSSPVQIPGTTWRSIVAGGQHSLATKTDGTLWAWGYNAFGQLGQNNTTYYSSPIQIPGTLWNSDSDTGNQHSIATQLA